MFGALAARQTLQTSLRGGVPARAATAGIQLIFL